MDIDQNQYTELIDGCLAGNKASERKLFETFYGKMLGVSMRYTNDSDQAKDILQDGFIKVFDKLGKFNRKGSLEGWIRRIVVNTAIDSIRKQKRSMTIAHSEDKLDDGATDWDDDSVDEEEFTLQVNDVMSALTKLSPAYRTVFNLYVVENYSHREIAEKLGISEGTSKSNLAKARKNLKKLLLKEGHLNE
jgi:RNA polymerase sigma-70 factor (ECF subfamily)